ncbi:zf-CCHC domain-containing protein, partial [Tanacetum coccineum]
MAQENYVEGCSMQRPPLLEADGFCFWKTRFETYIKSKDIDLWQVIQNGNFYFEIEDSETKMIKETPYELPKDNQKKQLGKNNEAKMTLYNTLPHRVRTWYEKFLILHEETINSGFTLFNAIVTSLKSLDPDYSSKNHVRKFLRALSLKWRAKVTTIEEANDLATLPLDELIGNLKIYEMILASDGVASKPIKEKFMPVALKANVTWGQTSNDSVCQDVSGEDEDGEEEFSSIVKNLWKLFKKGNRFERENSFGNGGDRFDRGHGNRNKGVGTSRGKHNCYGCGSKNHFVDDCPKTKMKKAFFSGAWSDSEDGDQMEKDATCLMVIGSQK